MKLKEILQNYAANSTSVKKIEEKYSAKLPLEAIKILSVSDESTSLNDKSIFRILSLGEILDASDDMAVDFISKGLIPIIDVGDNDYISLDYNNQKWCLFNIADEIIFDTKDSVEDFV
ncbi:MAG: SMI1/KNR4 family protein [Synergistaceae bacterium]|jgi:hypothetical protein|nr:SMI1/KNR4 family protein [Synergistaceae bacterium]